MREPSLLALPGDGIGPEVMAEALRVLDALRLDITVQSDVVGGAAFDSDGHPLPERVLEKARGANAVLFGAVGGSQWDGVTYDKRPEAAIIGLRGALDLFANLRPAMVFDALVDASTLKPEVVRGLDLMIVRETTGGVYFGEPRGIETLADGTERGVNTEVYTTPEIERVARMAFELAKRRDGRVTSVEKANVMESGLLWRRVVAALAAREYPGLSLSHMYADNCAMQLVRNPRQFDVIVTGNLFGDLLSDLASMLTGSLGMLPSATLGPPGADGRRAALYEPIHGSAPDIAGQGMANPLGMILSLAMALRWSFGRETEADRVERACARALNRARTPDIAGGGLPTVGTRGMGDVVLSALTEYQ